MEFYAHKRKVADDVQWQLLSDHCRHTAKYAADCLQGIGLEKAGYLAGLIHDMGKFKQRFQNYLAEGNPKERGKVNHTFAGCRYMLEHYHGEQATSLTDLAAELVAYAAGAHHGLFDCVDLDGRLGFEHRRTKEGIHYDESFRNFLDECASAEELDGLFKAASREIGAVTEKVRPLLTGDGEAQFQAFSFYLGLLARLLLSAVIEGDRRDTAEFMAGEIKPDVVVDWQAQLAQMESKLANFALDTEIRQARMAISDQCRAAADASGGILRLNVPTGSGKTLSALRFALAHAARHGKKRLIFVTPLLSILDQNADEIRKYIDNDEIILEHHSNVVQPERKADELDLRELAVESWQASVIITTLVQFLNTLFLGKTTSVRRFQALCDAVVVIDEVQTVPRHMLSLFNLAVNFLSSVCGTTFLLCSATQPCFEQAQHPMLEAVRDLVPYEDALWQPFRRTTICNARSRPLEEMPAFLENLLAEANHLLVVCNTKREAETIFKALSWHANHCYHLSASMCMQHRQDTLKAMREALTREDESLICVATQVIEAGVDISFDCVVRLMAGLDNVIQAAGRCNRNGEQEGLAPVYVVECAGEKLAMLKEIQQGKDATGALVERYKKDPAAFAGDLGSDASVAWYYRKLFANMKQSGANSQDFPLKEERTSIFSLLSTNRAPQDEILQKKYMLTQAFSHAGARFEVFDDSTIDVIVPYGEGATLIDELYGIREDDIASLKAWQEKAKPYTIAIYEYQRKALGSRLQMQNGVYYISADAYDNDTGFTSEIDLSYLEG
ncbi:MAG: CRISPR-associated helicase Cas3' [Peptococcaceae bacterium]|nr:CRISPR-associated helicase Cas3' [Peptococcaceae bacterium]